MVIPDSVVANDPELKRLKREYDQDCADLVEQQQAITGVKAIITVTSWLLMLEGAPPVELFGRAMSGFNTLDTVIRFLPTSRNRALQQCGELEQQIHLREAEIARQKQLPSDVFNGIRNQEGLVKTQRVRARTNWDSYAKRYKVVTGKTLVYSFVDPYPDSQAAKDTQEGSNLIWKKLHGKRAVAPRKRAFGAAKRSTAKKAAATRKPTAKKRPARAAKKTRARARR